MNPLLARHLKLNHLRLIAALAEHGQLSRAAEILSITQPAASRMLAEIETTLGTRLCVRQPRGLELTLIGKVLARRAYNLLVEMRDLEREVEELKQGKEGSARVGAVTGAAVGYVVPAIRQLKALSPNADILIDVSPSDKLLHDLLAGEHDFILSRMPADADAAEFIVHPGRPEVVDLVVHHSHPLSSVEQISLNKLGSYGWVMQSPGYPIREAVKDAFLRANARLPENIINTSSLLVMLAMLESSRLIVPMAREVFQLLAGNELGARVKRLPLLEPLQVSPYHLIRVRGRRLSPLANRLSALVLEELASGQAARLFDKEGLA